MFIINPGKIISMKKLGERETWSLLKRWKIPVAEYFLAKNPEQAAGFAERVGYPVVLKISSREIIHKTEAGGVESCLKNEKDVKHAFERIMRNAGKAYPKAKIDGVLVQKMMEGHEIILGSKTDPQFGPVLMFGMGGIFVEVLKDVTFRLIPVTRKDVREMIHEIKGYKILKGTRGQRPVNFRMLENILLRVSDMVWKTEKPEIKELDINPLFVNSREAVAVDVRILV